MSEKNYKQTLIVSKISIASFFLSILCYVSFIGIARVHVTVLRIIMVIFAISLPIPTLILSIIDLTKQNRKKVLSIISVIITGWYILQISAVILILARNGSPTN